MKAWDQFLSCLREELGQETIDKWLRPLTVTHFDAGNLYLEATDPFQVSWFEEHIRPLAQKNLCNENKRTIRVHLSLPKKSEPPRERKEAPPLPIRQTPLDPYALFETFIPTEGTKIAYTLLQKLDTPIYNPIFLFGPASSGKTHLLMALAHLWKNNGKKICYVHADSFTAHLVDSIRKGNMKAFRETYRSSDTLIVDDVHLLGGRLSTQEEFFHTFNFLHMGGKQLVLSSKLPAREIEGIEERLISRFEWGLPLSLVPPTREEKKEILIERSKKRGLTLSPTILEFLLHHFQRSCGTLLRAVDALVLHHHLYPSDLSLTTEQVSQILSPLLAEEKNASLTPEAILRTVASFFSLTSEEIRGKSQEKEKVYPRQLSMYLLRAKLALTYAQIGTLFSRDHSTVITSIRSIETKAKKREEGVQRHLLDLEKDLERYTQMNS